MLGGEGLAPSILTGLTCARSDECKQVALRQLQDAARRAQAICACKTLEGLLAGWQAGWV